MNKKVKYFIYIALVVLILTVFVFFFIKKARNNFQNNITPNASAVIVDIENKSFAADDIKQEIGKLEARLSAEKLSLEEEASVKLLLGYDKVFTQQGEEMREGADLLKEIIADSRYLAKIRAEAIYDITMLYKNPPSALLPSLYLIPMMYYFNNSTTPFFKEIWEKGEKNISLSFAKLNEFSDELYPDPLTNYWIAAAYSYQIHREDISAEKKNYYIAEIKKRIAKGDSLMSSLEGVNGSNLKKMLAYENKALSLAQLYFIQEAEINPVEIDLLYDKSVKILDSAPENEVKQNFYYYPRYNYAVFLARWDKDKNKAKIEELLAPFYDTKMQDGNYTIKSFLRAIESEPSGIFKKDLTALIAADEKFKQLLEKN